MKKLLLFGLILAVLVSSAYPFEYVYSKNKTTEIKTDSYINVTFLDPKYEIQIDEICCSVSNVSCFTCTEGQTNQTCLDNGCYNQTNNVIVSYKNKTKLEKITTITYETVVDNTSKIIGVIVDNLTYYNAYAKDDKLYIWNIPMGDRNFNEYGKCRDYEISKGVCTETKLEDVASEI